jgi:hypothetical protein
MNANTVNELTIAMTSGSLFAFASLASRFGGISDMVPSDLYLIATGFQEFRPCSCPPASVLDT